MSFEWTSGDGIAYGIICLSILAILVVGLLLLKKASLIEINKKYPEDNNDKFYEMERRMKRAQIVCTIGQFLCSFNLPICLLFAFVINL